MESLSLQGQGVGLGKLTSSCVLAPESGSVTWVIGQLYPDASSFCPDGCCWCSQFLLPVLLQTVTPYLSLSLYSNGILLISNNQKYKSQRADK